MAKAQANETESTDQASEVDWKSQFEALQKQVEQLVLAQAQNAASPKSADDKMGVMLEILMSNQKAIMENQKTLAERAEESRKQWVSDMQALVDRIDADLIAGEQLFHVSLKGKNRDLPKLVGARSPDEAMGKFNRYFGITASDRQHEVVLLTNEHNSVDAVLKEQREADLKAGTCITRGRTQFTDAAA